MTERQPRPEVGENIHYFEPTLLKKTGYGRGHDDRGIGPYHATVTNDIGAGLATVVSFPMQPPFAIRVMYQKDDEKRRPDDPYWDWVSPLQKARAVKRLAETPEPPAAPERNTKVHPGSARKMEAQA